jgi:hypothetical protein
MLTRTLTNLECDLEEGLPTSWCIPLANRAGRDDSEVEVGIVGVEIGNVVRAVVYSIAAANSHSVENVVELHSQLSADSLAQEESLAKSQDGCRFGKSLPREQAYGWNRHGTIPQILWKISTEKRPSRKLADPKRKKLKPALMGLSAIEV